MSFLFLDPILPKDMNVALRIFIYVMVMLHAFALIYWFYLLIRSSQMTPAEKLKMQMEARLFLFYENYMAVFGKLNYQEINMKRKWLKNKV